MRLSTCRNRGAYPNVEPILDVVRKLASLPATELATEYASRACTGSRGACGFDPSERPVLQRDDSRVEPGEPGEPRDGTEHSSAVRRSGSIFPREGYSSRSMDSGFAARSASRMLGPAMLGPAVVRPGRMMASRSRGSAVCWHML